MSSKTLSFLIYFQQYSYQTTHIICKCVIIIICFFMFFQSVGQNMFNFIWFVSSILCMLSWYSSWFHRDSSQPCPIHARSALLIAAQHNISHPINSTQQLSSHQLNPSHPINELSHQCTTNRRQIHYENNQPQMPAHWCDSQHEATGRASRKAFRQHAQWVADGNGGDGMRKHEPTRGGGRRGWDHRGPPTAGHPNRSLRTRIPQ
jgi:hypothetical protein